MNTERCWNCGRAEHAHIGKNRACPTGVVLTITADALDRVARTGHPRLLKLMLSGQVKQAFENVSVTAIHVVEEPQVKQPA